MVYTLTRVSAYKASCTHGGHPFPGAAPVLPSLQCCSSLLRSFHCFLAFLRDFLVDVSLGGCA